MATTRGTSQSRLARLGGIMKPLEWVQSATEVVKHTVPHVPMPRGADGPLDWVQQVDKQELRPGDHVYAWKFGYTYNHHGVVVHCQDCSADCSHDTLACGSIVHFRPPAGELPGCIELVPVAEFVQGRGLCRCRYGVPSAEFYFRRSGSCSTHEASPWPLTVIRALSLLEPEGPQMESNSGEAASAAQVEYDLLKKNSELLARWCKLGINSGVERFRSQETAYSPQTAPGRFLRLGAAIAVPAAIAAGAVAATAAAGATGASAAGSAAGAAGSAAAGTAAGSGTAASGAAALAGAAAARVAATSSAAGLVVRSAGEVALAASRQAATELMVDMARRPQQAHRVFEQVRRSLPAIPVVMPARQAQGVDRDDPRRRREEQDDALLAAFRSCLSRLEVQVPKSLGQVLEDPAGCSRLCEILVDVLEEAGPREERGCSVIMKSFLEDLQG